MFAALLVLSAAPVVLATKKPFKPGHYENPTCVTNDARLCSFQSLKFFLRSDRNIDIFVLEATRNTQIRF